MYRILDDLVHIVGDFVCFSDDLFSTPEKLVYSSEDLVNKTEHLVDISEDLIHRAGQLVYIQSRRHYLEDPVYDPENPVNVSDAQRAKRGQLENISQDAISWENHIQYPGDRNVRFLPRTKSKPSASAQTLSQERTVNALD